MKYTLFFLFSLTFCLTFKSTAQITELPIGDLSNKYPYILSIKAVTAEEADNRIGYLIINLDQDKLYDKVKQLIRDSVKAVIDRSGFRITLDSVYGTGERAFMYKTDQTSEILTHIDSLRWMNTFNTVWKDMDPAHRSCLAGHWFDFYVTTILKGRIVTSSSNEKSIVFSLDSFIREFYISGLVANNQICYKTNAKTFRDFRELSFGRIDEAGIQSFIEHTKYIRFGQDYASKKLWCYLALEK